MVGQGNVFRRNAYCIGRKGEKEKMIDIIKYDYKRVKIKCAKVDKIFIGEALVGTDEETDRDYIRLTDENDGGLYEIFVDKIESIEVIED